jgi:LAO/AO transport system kinase
VAETDRDHQAAFVTNMMNLPSSAEAGLQDLLAKLVAGDRRALAKSITLVESSRPADRAPAARLTNLALTHAGRAIRIGLSGPPGVGKSTFIEAFGTWLTDRGHRVAVLAVDPSSRRSGGSILGDKTRMARLTQSPLAFIRPSPAGTTLGGVARRTRESILLVEAAGFDVVIVETVGVGQSETAVADMVDVFTLLLAPSGGDELQGMKRGIMELTDIVLVTKADGDLLPAATRTASEYAAALHFMKPKFEGWAPEVAMVSSPAGKGIPEYWDLVSRFRTTQETSGQWAASRQHQQVSWFWNEVREGLVGLLTDTPELRTELKRLEKKVAGGAMTPASAAKEILDRAFPKA